MNHTAIFAMFKQRILLTLLLLSVSLMSQADSTDISQNPLFTNASVPPNLMLLLDDSGSMDWDILTVPHWRWRNYDPDAYRLTAKGSNLFNHSNHWRAYDKYWNKVTDGSWHSYPGICVDRNKDGVCYTRKHLNCDGDYSDCERSSTTCYTGNCEVVEDGDDDDNDDGPPEEDPPSDPPLPSPPQSKYPFDTGRLLALLTGSKSTFAAPPSCKYTRPSCGSGYTPTSYTCSLDFPQHGNSPADGIIERNYCESDYLKEEVTYRYLEWQADNVYRQSDEADKGKQCTKQYHYADKRRTTASTCAIVDVAAVSNDPVYSNDPWPVAVDWRIRSASFNVLWYNPGTTYNPWHGLPAASFDGVHSNPQPGTSGYALAAKDLDGFVFEVWHDDSGFCGDRPLRKKWSVGTGPCPPVSVPPATTHYYFNYDANPNSAIDLWDTHTRYTVYSNHILIQSVARKPNRITGLLETSITDMADLAGGDTYELLGNGTPGHGRTIAEVQQNIANWYEFARKRSFVAKGAISYVLNEYPDLRYGLSATSTACKAWADTTGSSCAAFGSTPNLFVNISDNDDTLTTQLYNHAWPAVATPLRSALEASGKYFQGLLNDPASNNTLPSPVTLSCQNNFSLLLTDGYWSGPNPTIGNEDNDTYSKTLADVASYFFQQDLNTVLPDEQNIRTIGIGFGVKGDLEASGNSHWPNNNPPLGASDDWSEFNPAKLRTADKEVSFDACGDPPSYECPAKLDDLWHASYNSQGLYLDASSPEKLRTSLEEAVAFASKADGSGSSGGTNSNTLIKGSYYYESSFRTAEWTGNVASFIIDNDAASLVSTPRWDAQSVLDLTDPASRNIITYHPDNDQAINFSWVTISAAQKALLKINPLTGSLEGDAEGQARLDFLRGAPNPSIRDRNHILGDIVHSAPVYVGAPNSHWLGKLQPENSVKSYTSFSGTDYPNRTPMVYVGANDGMLHAFEDIDASDNPSGAERFAYVPSSVFKNLNRLTLPADNDNPMPHTYFVDATPQVGDVFYDSDWHSVLIGALGAGGQGLYALDITDPPTSSAAISEFTGRVLWEFTDQDDRDLGYTFSQPVITRVNNGGGFQWVAIFGNGYNNTEADGNASISGDAVLYIVDIKTGAVVKKISTNAGSAITPNGLATPAVVDMNGDYVADYVYAGDLLGNLWRFDLTDISPASWNVSFGGNPLFTATNDASDMQPITTRPVVSRHPNGISKGVIVNFGTGQFLGSGDVQGVGAPTQTFYGIWDDKSTSNLNRSKLFKQSIKAEIFDNDNGFDLRVTTQTPKPFPWSDGTPAAPNNKFGWYLDLIDPDDNDNHGERIVTNPQMVGRGVLVNTLLPPTNTENSCDGGGSGWKMLIDAATGGRLNYPPFDLDGNSIFDDKDRVEYTDPDTHEVIKLPPSGKKSTGGIPATTDLIGNGDTILGLTRDSGGNTEKDGFNPGGALGRTSWSELRY